MGTNRRHVRTRFRSSSFLCKEIVIALPNNQRQHRTLHIQKDVPPYALC